MIAAGQYEGQAIKGSVQMGETGTGTLQIAINMDLFDTQNNSVGQMTTFLYFSAEAAVYAYERLRALGWKGEGAKDITKLDDIFSTRVPCLVKAPEKYQDPQTKEWKMGSAKCDIVTGGTVTLSKPLDVSTFAARLAALGGPGGGAGPSTPAGGNAPPF